MISIQIAKMSDSVASKLLPVRLRMRETCFEKSLIAVPGRARLLRLPFSPLHAQKVIPNARHIASTEPPCHALGYRGLGSWSEKFSRKRRVGARVSVVICVATRVCFVSVDSLAPEQTPAQTSAPRLVRHVVPLLCHQQDCAGKIMTFVSRQ